MLKTFVRVSIITGFGVAVFGYATRYNVSNKFSTQPYYESGIDLLKGYKPALEKLGEPIEFKKIEITDEFNYHDETTARSKIPVIGKQRVAELLVYAHRADKTQPWWIEKLEIEYKGSGTKYKFYDGNYNKPKDLDNQNKPIVKSETTNSEFEYKK